MRSGALIALEVPWMFSTIISPLKLSGQYKATAFHYLFAFWFWLVSYDEPDFFHAGPVD